MYTDALYMYVIVNRQAINFYPESIQTIQCGIQAAHALSDFHFSFPDNSKLNQWKEHKTLRVLQTKNTEEFVNLVQTVLSYGYKYKIFCEPDIGHRYTAVAFEPMFALQGKAFFSDLSLAK